MQDNNRRCVMFLCEYRSLYGGNFLASLLKLEQSLSQVGYTCIYVFPKDVTVRSWYKYLTENGRTVELVDFSVKRSDVVNAINAIAEKHMVGIVHAHFGQVMNCELLAKKNKKLRVIIHIHSDFTLGRKLSFKKKLSRFMLYRLFSGRARFISVSPAFVQANPKKIVYVPNGLAGERIAARHIPGQELRRSLNIAENDILCELFGWSPQVKGVDIAVNAMKELHDKGSTDFKLMIVCGRDNTPEKIKNYIKNNTHCSGDEDYLVLVEPDEDVYRFHEAADILLSASRSEGFPYSVLEMLCTGKKCVVSDIDGTKWAKKYPLTFHFASEDSAACAEALEAARGRTVENADAVAAEIRDEYSIDKWCAGVMAAMGIGNNK